MMLGPVDEYFHSKNEPVKSCLEYMRRYILAMDENIEESWKYGMPFYSYKKKRFCYLWVDKKSGWPYLGITDGKGIEHPLLISENRKRMKILLLDPQKDLPMKLLDWLMEMMLNRVK